MTHKNSILELLLTDTYLRTLLQVKCLPMYIKKKKKNVPCDDTYPSCHRHPRPMECFDLS